MPFFLRAIAAMSGVLLLASAPAASAQAPPLVPSGPSATILVPDVELPEAVGSLVTPQGSGSISEAGPAEVGGGEGTPNAGGGTGTGPGTESESAEAALTRDHIVVFRSSVERPGEVADVLERRVGFDTELRFRRVIEGFAAPLTRSQIRELEADPRVAAVVPDGVVRVSAAQLTPGDSSPSGVRRIGAAGDGIVRGSSGENVAVIDTGIDLDHPDLNVANGKDCVGPEPADDGHWHGTHVAGTIAARNNGSGVTGVAPGTKVWAVRVLDSSGTGSWSQVICGIDWVKGTRMDADPSNDISVANLSLGGPLGRSLTRCPTASDPLHQAICSAVSAGVTIVVAAGNDDDPFDATFNASSPGGPPYIPAAYPEVLTVTSFGDSDGLPGGAGALTCDENADDRASAFSNYASTPQGGSHTIAAPGECVVSTVPGGYASSSGTSMAAPHVAGAAALCLSEGPAAGPCDGMSPGEISAWLSSEAATHSTTAPATGFAGDPGSALPGRIYGHAVWAPDEIPPTVAARAPEGVVSSSATISIGFSEEMNRSTTEPAIEVENLTSGASAAGVFSWSGSTVAFVPLTPLVEGHQYRITVGEGATDLVGNELASATSWTFRTVVYSESSASSLAVERGRRRVGAVTSLSADDGSFLSVRSTRRSRYTTQWVGRLQGIPNDLRDLVITYAGKSSRKCSQKLAIYSFREGRWLTVDSRSVGSSEHRIAKPVIDPAGFVSGDTGPGELRVRVRCVRRASTFTAQGDLLSAGFLAA